MIDRRKFLERSVLSTGSVLFSSVLLESCTKYGIPLPGGIPPPGGNTPPPLTPPPLLGWTLDWNDAAKTMVTQAISMYPEGGALLAGLVTIFWPSSKKDVWGDIKAQVEALVDQKIAAAVYQQVTEDLQGLNGQITLYLNEVKNGTPNEILSQWMIARSFFVNARPHFQSAGNELPLLPLLASFTNLYLSLLRDGVAFGQSWGRTGANHQQDIQDLKDAISSISTYTQNTYNTGRSALQQKTKADSHHIEPFKTVNRYDRQMSLTVLDFMDTWHYFDVTLYPNGTTQVYNREIYSDPYGTADNSGSIVIRTPVPTQLPTNVTVWGWDRIDAVQLTYPAGSGPGGVTQTPRMGDQPSGSRGGSNQPPAGGSFNLTPDNPIVHARVGSGSIVNAMAFGWAQGNTVGWMGGKAGLGGDSGWISYTNRALSSIHINGISNFYGSADLVVFGFQTWEPPEEAMRAIGALYVKTPKEQSAADFAKAFPKLAIPANLITDDLKAARKAYWAYIEARAKEFK